MINVSPRAASPTIIQKSTTWRPVRKGSTTWVPQHLICVAMLLASIGTASAQMTIDDAETAYWRGDYVAALAAFRIYAD